MAGESLPTWTQTPVVTATEVRNATGYLTERDVPTTTVDDLVKKAQALTMQRLASRVAINLWGTRDGANLRFSIPPRLVGRVILDSDASGNASTDATVTLESAGAQSGYPPTFAPATVASIDEVNGIVTLSAAPAATVKRVTFRGWLIDDPLSKEAFAATVLLLACHLVDKRIREQGAVVLSNPSATGSSRDGTPGIRSWYAEWEAAVESLRRPRPRVAAVKTAIRGLGIGRVECAGPDEGCWP